MSLYGEYPAHSSPHSKKQNLPVCLLCSEPQVEEPFPSECGHQACRVCHLRATVALLDAHASDLYDLLSLPADLRPITTFSSLLSSPHSGGHHRPKDLRPRCPFPGCRQVLALEEVQVMLGNNTFREIDRRSAPRVAEAADAVTRQQEANALLNQPIECLICFERQARAGLFQPRGCEGHHFCHDCSLGYLRQQVEQGRVIDIRCPGDQCPGLLDQDEIEYLLRQDPGVKERLLELQRERALDLMDDVRRCPKCSAAFVIRPGDQVVACPNRGCDARWCVRCNQGHDAQNTCEQYVEWLKLNNNAEFETLKWAREGMRVRCCPKCREPIEKNQGCDHMTCAKCKASFNWSQAQGQ